MKTAIKDAILLTILSAVLAFGINAISPKGIPIIGDWYDNREKVELEVPPSFDATMDTLISLQEAYLLWKDSSAIFLDAREPEEYDHSHVPGAVNLPFDYWDDCWDRVEPLLKTTDTIVCYCGGFDCESSLFAARELRIIGYKNALIFFGGINKWREAGLPIEVGSEGSEYENGFYGE